MWSLYKKLKRFMEKESVEKIVGTAKFQVDNRPLFYYGGGFFLGYSTKKFKIENLDRIEYGEDGLFLTNVYHFTSKELLMKYLNIDEFEDSNIMPFEEDIIDGYVNYNTEYSDVRKAHKEANKGEYYQEGESRRMLNGEFVFQNRFINWEPFFLYFEKDSSKAKVSGFKYTPIEET